MNKTIKILERLNESYIKRRLLVLSLAIQNIILSLIMLMYANVIISNGKINGELDYTQVSFFYNMAIVLLFIVICIFAPYLLSNSLNILYENNVIEHLLAVKINFSEIVFAVYLRGIRTLLILVVSAFPIISISFYFGGFSLQRIVRLFLLIIIFAIFISSICIFISTKILDKNIAIIIAYVISFIFTVINILYLNKALYSVSYTFIYSLLLMIISLILLSVARNSKIFNT